MIQLQSIYRACSVGFLAAQSMLFAVQLSAAAPDNFLAEDVFELEYASDPQVAPSGSQVVYVRRSNDIMTDSTRSNIWIAAVDGSDHRPLLSGQDNFNSPRWSPDGSRLAYLSTIERGQ